MDLIFIFIFMKTTFLISHSLKKLGWILFILPFIIFFVFQFKGLEFFEYLHCPVFAVYNDEFLKNSGFFKIINVAILDEILLVSCLVGGLIVGFAKLKNEDEMISKIRYESLVWATYFNVISIVLCTIFIYGIIFFNFMMFFMISSLLFFIIRFHYMVYKLNKTNQDEE